MILFLEGMGSLTGWTEVQWAYKHMGNKRNGESQAKTHFVAILSLSFYYAINVDMMGSEKRWISIIEWFFTMWLCQFILNHKYQT